MNPNPMQNYGRIRKLGVVTKGFGGQTRYEAHHPGVDIANKEGTPIPAMTSGTVTNVITGQPKGANNFGNQVAIKGDNGETQYYSHVKNSFVKRGQRVHSGQPIAGMSSTGSAYSPSGGDATHLDLRVVDAYGRYKNPMNLVQKYL